MARSDRARLAAVLAALALPVALVFACNQLTGIADFTSFDCTQDCDAGGDNGNTLQNDAGDAEAGPEVSLPDSPQADVQIDAIPSPAATLLWARWPMPNPPDAGADVNIASYGSGSTADIVDDINTGLEWTVATSTQATFEEAYAYCLTVGTDGFAWRLPTRIELASLLDWTRNPAIDPAWFPDASGGDYWTWSVVAGTDGGDYWSVNFSTAAVTDGVGAGPRSVRCVRHP